MQNQMRWYQRRKSTRFLVGRPQVDRIEEYVIVYAMKNRLHSQAILEILEDRWGTLSFPIYPLALAVEFRRADVVQFVLSRCEDRVKRAVSHEREQNVIIENLLLAAIRNQIDGDHVIDLLMRQNPSASVGEGVFKEALVNF